MFDGFPTRYAVITNSYSAFFWKRSHFVILQISSTLYRHQSISEWRIRLEKVAHCLPCYGDIFTALHSSVVNLPKLLTAEKVFPLPCVSIIQVNTGIRRTELGMNSVAEVLPKTAFPGVDVVYEFLTAAPTAVVRG